MGQHVFDWDRIDPKCGSFPPASVFPPDLPEQVDELLPVLDDAELMDELEKAAGVHALELYIVCEKIQSELERRCPLCRRSTDDLNRLLEIYVYSRKYHPFDDDIDKIANELEKRGAITIVRNARATNCGASP